MARTLCRAAIVALAVQGADAGFNLGKIGNVVKNVGKEAVQQIPDDPRKLVEGAGKTASSTASEALKSVDTGKAVDAAKDAAAAAQGAKDSLPALSINVGGGKSEQKQPETTEPPTTTAAASKQPEANKEDQVEKVKSAVKSSPFSGLLSGKGIDLKQVTGGKVADTLTKADPTKLGEVAKGVSQIVDAAQDATVKDVSKAVDSSAVSQAVDKVHDAIDQHQDVVGAIGDSKVVDKAKTATVQDVVDLGKTDGGKKGGQFIKGATLHDIHNAVGIADKDAVKKVVSDPAGAIKNIGKKDTKNLRQPADSEESGGAGSSFMVVLLVLATAVVGGGLAFRHLTKPRNVGAPMLSGDHDEGNMVMMSSPSGHWMGSGARDVIANAQGGPAGFTRF